MKDKMSVAPMLSVRGGAAALKFYATAFDAIELFKIEAPDGEIVAELSAGGAVFWVADESPDHGNFSPDSLGGSTVRMILTVSDPDGVFEQAIAAGGREISPVSESYGWRLGRLIDPFGHHWEIGRRLE